MKKEIGSIWQEGDVWNVMTQTGIMEMSTKSNAEAAVELWPGLCGPEATEEEAVLVQKMKDWAMDNYNNGADTMVECWEDHDYLDILRTSKDLDEAMDVLEGVADVFMDQINDARNSAF